MTDTGPRIPRRRILYVAPDCTDSAVQKRARGFVRAGQEVVSFSFRRHRYNAQYAPDWPNIELGQTTERRLFDRVMMCLQAIRAIFRHGRLWRRADLLYVRNLDLAVLAMIGKLVTGCRAPLVYEVLDVHPALTTPGLQSSILRWIEQRVLRHSRLLVVSSPAFIDSYFRPIQRYSGRYFLLENKWPYDCMTTQARRLPCVWDEHAPCWTIGWFGNIRCEQSLCILAQLADALPDRVRIRMRGCISLMGEQLVQDTIRDRRNMVYEGEYIAPQDLQAIYANTHFNWCIDLSGHDNSKWLLPNRLYEGGYFGVPAVAVASHQTGRTVRERHLGIAVDFPLATRLQEYLTALTSEAYRQLRDQIEALDLPLFVDVGEIAELMRQLPEPGARTRRLTQPAETAA